MRADRRLHRLVDGPGARRRRGGGRPGVSPPPAAPPDGGAVGPAGSFIAGGGPLGTGAGTGGGSVAAVGVGKAARARCATSSTLPRRGLRIPTTSGETTSPIAAVPRTTPRPTAAPPPSVLRTACPRAGRAYGT